MENTEIIMATLKKAGKPLKCGEIASLSGLDRKIVDKYIKDLYKTGTIISPIRCHYQIK
jgi:predicted transcriptional regulator